MQEKGFTNSKIYFEKKGEAKSKKKNIIFTIHEYFLNNAFKVATSRTKRAINPISETRNVNDAGMYVWFIHSRIKRCNAKILNVKIH